ncbi:MAG: hypothetical protein HKM22_05715 [Gammaproteobacteria bacterium]|nr:hypothetical protein [Gammaproteobacteria bacterium]
MHWPTTLLLASLVSTPALAADETYDAWDNPATDTRKFVNELRQLVDKADSAKAADPKFLRDLRQLASRYDKPLLRTLFNDDFRDGDFTHNLAWQVVDGKFWVDPNMGLRSRVEQYQSSSKEKEQPADIGNVLLGALLSELDKDKKKKEEKSEQFRYQPAVIRLDHRIPNAFVMRAELVSEQPLGRVDFALYQDSQKLSGYRLTYTPGSNQPFQFLRVSERGEAVIDAYRKPLNLKDNQVHTLEWRRDLAGKMTLKLNGTLLFSTEDSWLRKDFNGFALINNGGDYALRRITLSEVY